MLMYDAIMSFLKLIMHVSGVSQYNQLCAVSSTSLYAHCSILTVV
jgi:hypothetical protein